MYFPPRCNATARVTFLTITEMAGLNSPKAFAVFLSHPSSDKCDWILENRP